MYPGNRTLRRYWALLSLGRASVLVCLCWLSFGCHKPRPQEFSEQEVQRALSPGTHRQTVEKTFGKPVLVRLKKDGSTMAIYTWSENITIAEFEDKFTGFDVHYTNNFVDRWSPIYSTKFRASSVTGTDRAPVQLSDVVEDGRPSGPASGVISFYCVSESATEGTSFLNTPSLPNVGFIKERPDLEIRTIKTAARGSITKNSQGKQQQVPVIMIDLLRDDAETMARLTEKHIGERLLITVDGSPVSAPFIIVPIGSSFNFPCRDEKHQDELMQQLQKLVK